MVVIRSVVHLQNSYFQVNLEVKDDEDYTSSSGELDTFESDVFAGGDKQKKFFSIPTFS